jgi:uncharacterized protein (TIGR00730 family)
MISRICVYCSSSAHVHPLFFEAAEELGRLIASEGYQLVFGGGNLGLMGALSRSAKKLGGHIISVNLKLFVKEGINFEGADELVVSETMNERKRIMADRSDAFIALAGGFGTLEELAEVLTLKQLHFHKKPIVIINTKQYYDHLLSWLEHSYEEKFVKEKYRSIYHVAADAAGAMEYLRGYTPVDLPLKW